MASNQLHSIVANDFNAVNNVIHQQLSSNVPLVEHIGKYIIDSGGKRLRPLLVLLSAKACQYQGSEHVTLAAIIEFLHTATLLHDDVVDESDLRRGKATANNRWSNASSVLVGDFLYSRAFQMMVSLGSHDILRVLSDATCVIAEGEVLQLTNCKNPDVTEIQYMDVIRGKTAMLFEESSHCGALLANASPEQVTALQNYGSHLGLAFQLVDDALDYTGNADAMGKNLGDDLAEGKPTLPLIQAMKVCPDSDRKLLRKAIRSGGIDHLDDILAIIQSSGAIDYTLSLAQTHADKANSSLTSLTNSAYKETLQTLSLAAVNRDR